MRTVAATVAVAGVLCMLCMLCGRAVAAPTKIWSIGYDSSSSSSSPPSYEFSQAASATQLFVLGTARYTDATSSADTVSAVLAVCSADAASCTEVQLVAPTANSNFRWGAGASVAVDGDKAFGAFQTSSSSISIFTCPDAACGSPVVTDHTVASMSGSALISVVVSASGEKRIWWGSSNGISQVSCSNADCSSISSETGIYNSKVYSMDLKLLNGAPYMAFVAGSTRAGCSSAPDGLFTLACDFYNCSAATLFAVQDGIMPSCGSSLLANPPTAVATNPIRVTYYNLTTKEYRVAACSSPGCMSPTYNVVSRPATQPGYSIAVGVNAADGSRGPAFVDDTPSTTGYVAWTCDDPACATTAISGTSAVVSSGSSLDYSVLAHAPSSSLDLSVVYTSNSASISTVYLDGLASSSLVPGGSTAVGSSSATVLPSAATVIGAAIALIATLALL